MYDFRPRNQFDLAEFVIRQRVGQSLVREPQLWHVDHRSVRLQALPSGYIQLEFVLLRVAWPPALCHVSLLHADTAGFGIEWTADRIDHRIAEGRRATQHLLLNFNGLGPWQPFPPFKQSYTVRRRVLVDMYKDSFLRNRLHKITQGLLVMYSRLEVRGGCAHVSIDAVHPCIGW